MDPVTIMMGVTSLIGLGTSLFGTAKSVGASEQAASISSQIYGVSQQIAGVEMQENYQRYLAMIYGSQRQEMENLRKTQQQMAMVRSNAANNAGGSQYNSEAKMGEGAAVAGGAFNSGGLLQSIQSGTAMYGLTNQQTALQGEQAGLQSQLAIAQGNIAAGQGISQFGSGLMAGAGPLSKFAGSFVPGGGSGAGPSWFGSNNPYLGMG